MALSDLLGAAAGEVLTNLTNVTDEYIDLEKVIPSVNNLLFDQASELRKLNKELGTGTKTVASFRGQIADLSKTIGVSVRDVSELVSSTNSYHQGITKTTRATLMFSKAVGEMPKNLGEFSAKLTILGHTSEASFTQMYKNILAVRNAYGLTSEQIDSIIEVTTKYAVVTQASTEQIESATLALSKFTSQLTEVGIGTERVTELINGMFDPDKMMDNIVLMNKLGISVNDMISGDPTTKLEGSTEKLKELGQEIMNIAKNNRMQANEMAKVYGITLEEARQFAEIDTSDKAIDTQKKLEEYQSEMQTFANSIESLKNMIGGVMSGPLAFIGNIIQGFTDTMALLPKGLLAFFGAGAVKLLLNKIVGFFGEKIGQAAKKWGEKFSEPMAKYLGAVSGKYGIKQEDMKNLAPSGIPERSPEDVLGKASFGQRIRFAAENKANNKAARIAERERAKALKEGNYSALTPGEFAEEMQRRVRQDEEKVNAIKQLRASGQTAKAAYYERQYTPILDENGNSRMADQFKDIMAIKGSGYGDLSDQYKYATKSYKTASAKDKSSAADMVTYQFGKETGLDNLNYGDEETKTKAAEILSDESIEGTRDALNALKEFFKAVGTKESEENIKAIDEELAKMNKTLEESPEFTIKATEALKQHDAAMEQSAKASKSMRGENVRSGFKGLFSLLGGWKAALIGLGLKLAGGIMSSVAKNEKVSKAMEKLRKGMDSVVKKITNFFKPVVDWIGDKLESVSNWFAGLTGGVDDIDENVSTISDSYKQEDLATMVGGVAALENGVLQARLDDMYYEITKFRRETRGRLDTANELETLNQQKS